MPRCTCILHDPDAFTTIKENPMSEPTPDWRPVVGYVLTSHNGGLTIVPDLGQELPAVHADVEVRPFDRESVYQSGPKPDHDDVLDDYEDRCEKKSNPRQPDPEVEALRSISAALEPLDRAARERVVGWAIARFDIHGINGFEIVSATAMVATPEAAAAIAKRGNTTYRCQVQQAGSGTCTWPTCGCGDA